MGTDAGKLKRDYNDALSRFRKAEAWFDSPEISHEEKLEHEAALVALIRECGTLTNKLKAAGVTLTREQILSGFPEV